MWNKDEIVIRELAKKYVDLCKTDRNMKAIQLWRQHNNLVKTRPLVLVDCFWTSSPMSHEIDAKLEPNKTKHLGWAENWFKRQIWQASNILDDTVYNPWFSMESKRVESNGLWGFDLDKKSDFDSKGYRYFPQIRIVDDLKKLQSTPHRVLDNNPPDVQMMREILGDILPVHVKCSTVYPIWGGTDLSEALGKLVGMQEFMIMLYEQPKIIHELMAFMRDAVLENITQGEKNGDWTTVDSMNYVMPHTEGLPQPKANSYGAKLKDLWFFSHAQEFEGVSSSQHREFLLNYQLPIMNKFGFISYGCCETLDRKIDLLREIPNLRRICIGPNADVSRSAEQIGRDYIMSWRPNPSMVSHNYDIAECKKIVRQGYKDSQECNIELMLKEMLTIQNDPNRLHEFAEMAINEAESM
jgi:hypothetical protein